MANWHMMLAQAANGHHLKISVTSQPYQMLILIDLSGRLIPVGHLLLCIAYFALLSILTPMTLT